MKPKDQELEDLMEKLGMNPKSKNLTIAQQVGKQAMDMAQAMLDKYKKSK